MIARMFALLLCAGLAGCANESRESGRQETAPVQELPGGDPEAGHGSGNTIENPGTSGY